MRAAEEKLFGNDKWWDGDGAHRLLHDINPIRLQLTTAAANGLAGKKVLDVGCGGGIFSESAAKAGAVVRGVDICGAAVECAAKHAREQKLSIEYRCQDGVADEDIGVFDVAVCFEMLEHSARPADIVAAVASSLNANGVAVFSTINRTLGAWGVMIVGLENALKILPPGAHEYRRFIRPDELARWCKDGGMKIKRIAGLHYSFFGKCYWLDDKKNAVNYFLTAKRDDGESDFF